MRQDSPAVGKSALHGKRRESGIRFPVLSLCGRFILLGPYLAGLNLRVALGLASMAVPAERLHLLVELVSVNGTVK